jgi:F-type H+-transporting ATPase subunit a
MSIDRSVPAWCNSKAMIHISITPEVLFRVFGLPITNTLLTSWLVVALLSVSVIALYYTTLRRRSLSAPKRAQNLLEYIVESLLDLMASMAGNRALAEQYFPFVITIFLYILISNWIGLLPGVGSIGLAEGDHIIPFFRSVYTDLNMTLALSLLTVVGSHILGLRALGARRHLNKYFTLKSPLAAYTGVLELISEISKILSLAFRLFGNVFAGEVLLVIITFLAPYLAPAPFLAMELFVGLIQALIFALLAMVSFATAVAVPEH